MSWAFSPLLQSAAALAGRPFTLKSTNLSPVKSFESIKFGYFTNNNWEYPNNANSEVGDANYDVDGTKAGPTDSPKQTALLAFNGSGLGVPNSADTRITRLDVSARIRATDPTDLSLQYVRAIALYVTHDELMNPIVNTVATSEWSLVEVQLNTHFTKTFEIDFTPAFSEPGNLAAGNNIRLYKIALEFSKPAGRLAVKEFKPLVSYWEDYRIVPSTTVFIPPVDFTQTTNNLSVLSNVRTEEAIPTTAFTQSTLPLTVLATSKVVLPTANFTQSALIPVVISAAYVVPLSTTAFTQSTKLLLLNERRRELLLTANFTQSVLIPVVKNVVVSTVSIPTVNFTQASLLPEIGNFKSTAVISPTVITGSITEGGIPEFDWINPNNVKAQDGLTAYLNVNKSFKSPFLTFNLSELEIPASPDVHITKIEFSFVGRQDSDLSPVTVNARIFSGTTYSSAIGVQQNLTPITTSLAQHNFPASNFGLTPTQLNGSNFNTYKIGISATEAKFGNTFSVDVIKIKVTYSDARVLVNTVIDVPTVSFNQANLVPRVNAAENVVVPTAKFYASTLPISFNERRIEALPTNTFTQVTITPVVSGKDIVSLPVASFTQVNLIPNLIDRIKLTTTEFVQSVLSVKATATVKIPTVSFNQVTNLAEGNSKTLIELPTTDFNQSVQSIKVNEWIKVPNTVFVQVTFLAYIGNAIRIPTASFVQTTNPMVLLDNVRLPGVQFTQATLDILVNERIKVGPVDFHQLTLDIQLNEWIKLPTGEFFQGDSDIKIDDLIAPAIIEFIQTTLAAEIYIDIIPMWKATISWSNFVPGPDGKHALMKFYSETNDMQLTGRSTVKLPEVPTSVSYLEDVKDA